MATLSASQQAALSQLRRWVPYAVGLLLAVLRPPALRRLHAALRTRFNATLARWDQYGSALLALVVLSGVRQLLEVRRIWMREGLRTHLMRTLVPLLKALPWVAGELESAKRKVRLDVSTKLSREMSAPRRRLPSEGMLETELIELMHQRQLTDSKGYTDGTVTGAVYTDDANHMDLIGKFYGMFAYFNPLHATLHPATRQMDAEVVQMVLDLYKGPEGACGAFTTGGTESILLAMKSYRDRGRQQGIASPNIVCCVTAHAAFDKACAYFGIHLRHARATQQQAIDVQHARTLIDRETVCIVGSAPQYATGTIDPIEDLSLLALSRGIGLHLDCCLGGFLLPFMSAAGFPPPHVADFSLDGVTSISCDPHKYGFSPKGASVLMFRERELRHCMYSFATEWTGGIYATPTMLGSRPGGVVAATWASLVKHGFEGYVGSTRRVVSATRLIAEAIPTIEGLQLVGRADACVVAFATTKTSGINIYAIADCLMERTGWELATLQNPPALHLALTLPTSRNAQQFVDDLRAAVKAVSEEPDKFKGGTAGIYGTAASVPSAFLEESVKEYLDVCLAVGGEETPPP